jgi:hypothetical protein
MVFDLSKDCFGTGGSTAHTRSSTAVRVDIYTTSMIKSISYQLRK